MPSAKKGISRSGTHSTKRGPYARLAVPERRAMGPDAQQQAQEEANRRHRVETQGTYLH